jgi:hypothetical protein
VSLHTFGGTYELEAPDEAFSLTLGGSYFLDFNLPFSLTVGGSYELQAAEGPAPTVVRRMGGEWLAIVRRRRFDGAWVPPV